MNGCDAMRQWREEEEAPLRGSEQLKAVIYEETVWHQGHDH